MPRKIGRKLRFTSLFYKTKDPRRTPASWRWPSCHHARTHSFRNEEGGSECNESLQELESLSIASEYSGTDAVVRALKSDRFFFEPGKASSILEDGGAIVRVPFESSFAVPMESEDPYRDFRASMEEMVSAHGVKGWEWLEELLGWYLKVNVRRTHGFIIGAFLDLLLMLASSPSSLSCSSTSVSFEVEELEEDAESESC